MWLLYWLIDRWYRVQRIFDVIYYKIKDICETWYWNVRYVIYDRWGQLTNLIYYWYEQARWVLSTGYAYIINLAYYWYNNIRNIAFFWYEQARWVLSTGYAYIINLAYYWYGAIRDLVRNANFLLHLAIGIKNKLQGLFDTTFWDTLIGILQNPGAAIWAYIIKLAEVKLEELLDCYW